MNNITSYHIYIHTCLPLALSYIFINYKKRCQVSIDMGTSGVKFKIILASDPIGFIRDGNRYQDPPGFLLAKSSDHGFLCDIEIFHSFPVPSGNLT